MRVEAAGVGVRKKTRFVPRRDVAVAVAAQQRHRSVGGVRPDAVRDGRGGLRLLFVHRVGVELFFPHTLGPKPRDGDDADQDPEDADADAEERELGGRVTSVDPAVAVLQRGGVKSGGRRGEPGPLERLVQEVV